MSGKWSCLRFGRGDLSGVCFALSVMGVAGADGGFYRRVGVLGCGVAMMEQVTRGSKHDKGRGDGVAGGNGGGGCAAKGCGVVVGRMEAGTRAGGTGEWCGQ
jgi:hypothetical protein